MQMVMRYISSAFMTLVLSIPCFAQSVETLYDFEDAGLYYKIVSDGEVVISPVSKTEFEGIATYHGINGISNLRVVASVVYNDSFYTVVGIADHAFENSTDLLTVNFDYMTSIDNPITIGESAFENCDNLESVTITKGIKQIGTRAFFGCNRLNKIALGAGMEYSENCLTIKQDAFASNPKLQYVFLTNSRPESYIFESCFGDDIQNIIFYIPNRNFESEGAFSPYHKMLYGSFDDCRIPYSGEIPQITPIFKSNLPIGFTVGQPYVESYDKNVGTYNSFAGIRIFNGYPDYMVLDIRVPFNYTITPAPLTISTGNYERVYGEPNPDITINVTGYLNGDNESVFSTKPQIVNGISNWATLPDQTSDVGVYQIYVMADLPYGSNYECQYEIGTLTVIPADQAITWNLDKQDFYKGEMIELNALSSSGLPIEYTSSNSNIAKLENGKLLFLEEGNVTITASQSGNDNYNAAEPISKTLLVNARPSEELTLNISNADLKVQDQLQLVISYY